MDNYLSSRWPAGMAAQQEPETKQKKKRERKKGRQVWRSVLIIVLALVLLAGLTVGAFFGVQYAADKMLSQLPAQPEPPQSSGKPDLPVTPSPSPSAGILPGESWTADLLPRAEPDPGVQLNLLTREGQEILPATEIYKKVLPSIVSVQASNSMGYSMGSGVVLSESGYILTNYHVVEGGLDLDIMLLSDYTVYKAALVGYDKELDLAILKAEGSGFVPAELGSSDELEVGDPVYAIGNPLGYLYGAMSDGIVSALGDRVSELAYPGRLIQTTAALNSGNSGGALVDAYGRVIGITYAKVTGIREDVVVEGLGLAIPMSDARSYLNRILRTGDSARISLGILCYSPVTIETKDGEELTGILVSEATKGTPAFGKLLPDDFITELNGIRVYSVDDVTRILSEMDPGDTVELTVLRRDKTITVQVELYDRLSELQ